MSGSVEIVDLSGSAVTSHTYPLPFGAPQMYAAIPGGSWVSGNDSGAIVDGATVTAGQPRYLTLGAASGLAGVPTISVWQPPLARF